MIKVADLEAKIREQAGEIEILKLQIAGYQDDIAALKAVPAEAPKGKKPRPTT